MNDINPIGSLNADYYCRKCLVHDACSRLKTEAQVSGKTCTRKVSTSIRRNHADNAMDR